MQRVRFLAAGLLAAVTTGLGFANEPRLPPVEPVRGPTAFHSPEGKSGWKVVLPGSRPLATPAVADCKVLLGGGFDSHEFYAFDAHTGKQLWRYRTSNDGDGPTAAVVEGGYIAFNTESCELELLTLDGRPHWKKWLGDPLMSMPAIADGKVYMAYPDSKGDGQHRLACFDIASGAELWKQPIASAVITAPVIVGRQVFLASTDGTVYCFETRGGRLAWQEQHHATCSPVVWDGKCYFSRRHEIAALDAKGRPVVQQTEKLAARGLARLGGLFDFHTTTHTADYLDVGKRLERSTLEKQFQQLDAKVGSGAPAAPPGPSAGNIGQRSVSGIWSYQGSRPFVYQGRLFASMGGTVKCVDLETHELAWRQHLGGDLLAPPVDAMLTPPALVNGKLFVGSARGVLYCLRADDGAVLWQATIGEPIQFQPAVVRGRVYVTTTLGSLIGLATGDAADDGWCMWGGNAAHTGLIDNP